MLVKLPVLLAVLFAAVPPPAAAAAPEGGWTTKEVLFAIGSVLAVLVPVVWGGVKLLTKHLRAQVRKLEQELKKARPGNGPPPHDGTPPEEVGRIRHRLTIAEECIHTLEAAGKTKDQQIEALTAASKEQQSKHSEEIAALKANEVQHKEQSSETESFLQAEQRRIKKALQRDGQTWMAKVFHDAPRFKPLSPEGRHAPIISVLNLKGGVGKTTTTANLAAALDAMGYKTLLIDLDLQGSLSNLFLDEEKQREIQGSQHTLEDFLFASFDGEFPNLTEYARPVLQQSGIVTTSDLLAYTEMNLTVRWLLREGNRDVRFLLRKELHHKRVTDNYDVVLLDCPPLINVSCVNALAASDYLLIPVMPSRQSTARVPVLLKRLRDFCDNINPSLRILGILASRTFGSDLTFEEGNRMTELLSHCKDHWGSRVDRFATVIRQSKDFRAAEDEHRPLRPGEEVHESYRALAREIRDGLPMFCRPSGTAAPAQETFA